MSSSIQKVVFFGDSGVGVTALCKTATNGEGAYDFNTPKTTIGCDVYTKKLEIEGRKVQVQTWELAMNPRFELGLIKEYAFKYANAVVMCYDITNQASFENLKDHLKTAEEKAPNNFLRFIVGTKTDLYDKRVVKYSDAESFAKANNCVLIETSAKNNSETIISLINVISTAVFNKQAEEKLAQDKVTKEESNGDNSTLNLSRNRTIKRMCLFGLGSAVALAAAGVLFAIGAGAIRSRIGFHGYWMGGIAAITSLGLLYLVNTGRKKLAPNYELMD